MDDIRAMFLRQSLLDCEQTFLSAIARRDAPAWDYVIVTAANEAQAEAFRAQIELRLAAGLLPQQTRYVVLPDVHGKRVGSGGATLNALREIARAEGTETPFSQKKILVLHSGGDSRRIPQYSACGKLFSHVPRELPDGRPSTLFDEFCISLSCVPPRMTGGMLVVSGDVLLLFNALQIDLERVGAACLSIKAPVSVGTRHGVFLPDEHGNVRKFLHKQPEDTLRALGAVNAKGMVDIDTGAIWLDEVRVNALYGLVRESDARFDQFVNDRVRLSFYGDIVYPMAAESTLADYLAQAPEGDMSCELEACRIALFEAIGGAGISLIRLSPAEFLHFGTTDEWRELMLSGAERFPFLGWKRSVMSIGASPHFAAINSVIAPGARIGAGSAIEDARVGENAVIGDNCVLSGANFDGVLPDNTALHVLPIDGGAAHTARLYGVRDNPKERAHFGKPIQASLWDAPLHPCADTADGAIAAALCGGGAGGLLSLREGFERASVRTILKDQQRLTDEVRARRVIERLADGAYTEDVLPLLTRGASGKRQRDMLKAYADAADFPLKSRLYFFLARAMDDGEMEDACWQSVNDHLLAHASVAEGLKARIVRESAEAELPVRVNWGGGWSDTPPYCLEFGGAVLNASVLLSGKRPVRAFAARIASPVIRIESLDLAFSREYTDFSQIAPGNPNDPHALCKAALRVCGVMPDGAESLHDCLVRMGGGILLRTSVLGVPKGSGLGTSSILSAAVARALSRLLGLPDDDARIAAATLLMEQLMNTGGGWQDQVGGLIPGIKLTTSRPGTPQSLQWRKIVMPDAAFAELCERHVLVFTGQRRLARNILRDIMGKAVSREPETMAVLTQIQRLAVLMAFALETGDIAEFGRLLAEHWALSKRLDAGSSNTCIDQMVAAVSDLVDGAMIAGAGGGGFMSFLMKKGNARARLAERLDAVFQDSGVTVWDAEIEPSPDV